jgi:hypothetical protein
MFSEPITVTINSVDHDLPRVNQDNFGSRYLKRTSTHEYLLDIKHSGQGARDRHRVELRVTEFATSADESDVVNTSACTILAQPNQSAEVEDVTLGLAGWLTSANIAKFVNWES